MAKLVNEAVGLAAVSTGSPGKYKIRLIDAGIGSSGVYPAATLQQAAADRIFPKGTRVHLDHPFNQSEMSGPRSVKDWCAVLDEDATYNSEQESLESSIRVFKPYQQMIEEMKDEVGMSIIAFAETSPATTPGGLPVVDKLTEGLSVDFVTAAGRGGKILQVLEAAGSMPVKEATNGDRRSQLSKALTDAYQNEDNYVWVVDFDEEQHLVWFSTEGPRIWEQVYSVADDDLSVALDGEAVEVRAVTQYVRVNQEPDAQAQDQTEGAEMDPETKAKLDELTAANEALKTENTALKATQQAKENAEKAKALFAQAESLKSLPAAAQERVAKDALANLPVDEAGALNETALTTMVDESAKSEAEYLEAAKATGQPQNESLHGFGESNPVTEGASTPTRTHNPWGRPITTTKG